MTVQEVIQAQLSDFHFFTHVLLVDSVSSMTARSPLYHWTHLPLPALHIHLQALIGVTLSHWHIAVNVPLEHIFKCAPLRARDLYGIKGSSVTAVPTSNFTFGWRWSENGSGPSGRRSGTGGWETASEAAVCRQAGRYNKLSNESGLHLPAAELINPTILHRRPSMRERAKAEALYCYCVTLWHLSS